VCAKFGFLLGKTAVETVTMLKEAVKNKSMIKHNCMGGLIISKEVECLLKTNHVIYLLQLILLTLTLFKEGAERVFFRLTDTHHI